MPDSPGRVDEVLSSDVRAHARIIEPRPEAMPTATPSVADPLTVRRSWHSRISEHRGDLLVAALLTLAAITAIVRMSRVLSQPLWYDEQWRAFYFAFHGNAFWTQIRHANAPSGLLYVAVERLSSGVFGQTPWALRLPTAAAVPMLTLLTYLYARRLAPIVGAIFTAIMVGASAGVLAVAFQFKPYLVEAAAAVAVMLLWSAASEPERGARWQRVAWFTSAGVVSCFMVPGILLIGPLAVAEGLFRRGRVSRRLAAFADASPALAISLVHTGLFVAMQSAQRKSDYWNFAFASGRGFGGGLSFLARSTGDLAAGTFTGFTASSTPVAGVTQLGWVVPTVAVAVILGWVTAAVRLRQDRAARNLALVVITFVLGTALASTQRLWPYGLERTSIFMLPLLAVLAVAGWVQWCRAARSAVALTRHRSSDPRAPRILTAAVAGLLLVVVPAAGLGLLALNGARLDQWWVASHRPAYGQNLAQAAFDVQTMAKPGDLVAFGPVMARAGWLWALNSADNGPKGVPRVARKDQLAYATFNDGTVEAALRQRMSGQAFVYVARGAGPADDRELGAQFHAAGWCVNARRDYLVSGALLILERCT